MLREGNELQLLSGWWSLFTSVAYVKSLQMWNL